MSRTKRTKKGGLRSKFRRKSLSNSSSAERNLDVDTIRRHLNSGRYDNSKDFELLEDYINKLYKYQKSIREHNRQQRLTEDIGSNILDKDWSGRKKRYSLKKSRDKMNKKYREFNRTRKKVDKLTNKKRLHISSMAIRNKR